MFSARVVSSLLAIVLLSSVACDQVQPLGPALEVRAATASGSIVNGPSNLSAIAVSVSRIDLSWQDHSTNESGFEVQRSTTGASGAFTLRASLAANTTALSDSGLAASTQYCYKVRALQTKGSKTYLSPFSATACTTTPAPPPPPGPPNAPSGVGAIATFSTAGVSVSWADNSTNEDGFRIERSTDSSVTWTILITTSSTMVSDTGTAVEQQVCYRVFAFNAFGDSPSSNTACILPLAGPSNVVMVGDDLTWTDNSVFETGYELWYMDDNGGPAYEGLAGTYPANTTSIPGLGPCPLSWCWGWVVMAVSSDGQTSAYAAVQTRQP